MRYSRDPATHNDTYSSNCARESLIIITNLYILSSSRLDTYGCLLVMFCITMVGGHRLFAVRCRHTHTPLISASGYDCFSGLSDVPCTNIALRDYCQLHASSFQRREVGSHMFVNTISATQGSNAPRRSLSICDYLRKKLMEGHSFSILWL